MEELQLRREMVQIGHSLFSRGYVHATVGNISCQLGDGYLITPTDVCLGLLNIDCIVKAAVDGSVVTGGSPSKTLTLHRHIYAADSRAKCVIHTHSTHLVALSLSRKSFSKDWILPITPYFVMKVGHVPIIARVTPTSVHWSPKKYSQLNKTVDEFVQ